MRHIVFLFITVGVLFVGGTLYADAYDSRKIAECVEDNFDEKASTDVIRKYCTCMNRKIPAGETQSISDWEKSHPVDMAECDREAGWR